MSFLSHTTSPSNRAPVASDPARSVFTRGLREPLFHFVLLGTIIFMVSAWREKERPVANAGARIEVTAGTIAWLREGYAKQWHRVPDADELRGLVDDHLREEVL